MRDRSDQEKKQTALDPIFTESGLTLIRKLGEGRQSEVFLATRDSKSFAVKVQKREEPSSSSPHPESGTLFFLREAALLASLRRPGLPEIFDVGVRDSRAYMVEEFIEGSNLKQWLEKNEFSIPSLITFIRAMAPVFSKIHENGVIHRDIKSSNILLGKDQTPYLIDFGLAHRLTAGETTNDGVGTLAYCSPEQSGMIARPVDRRSDLYSFGVVLFECATRQLPFKSSDAAEMIKMHAFQKPPQVRDLRRDFPEALDRIIQKLIAKDPDDRYGTSEGLLRDVEDFELGLELESLGRHDFSDIGHEAGALIGREKQLESLKSDYARAKKSRGLVSFIESPSGVGKTRLTRELLRFARGDGATILKGKCDQSHGALPFSALREAIDGFLTRNRNDREKIRQALGPGGRLLKNFSPSMRELIGADDGLQVDNMTADQYFSLLSDFLLELSRLYHPLVLFIDDVQWLDDSSLSVLSLAADRASDRAFLFIATARADAESSEGVAKFKKAMGESLHSSLTLSPLKLEETSLLVESFLGGLHAEPLMVSQIQKRSDGVPFATIEYLRLLLDSGYLTPRWGSWHLHENGFQLLPLSQNLIDIVLKRADGLLADTRQMLAVAAIWGTKFKGEVVRDIGNLTPTQFHLGLGEALKCNLIETGDEPDEYEFIHDRIQEAFVRSVDESTRRKMHRRIASYLRRQTVSGDEFAYRIADHEHLSEDFSRPLEIFESQLAAARKALFEFAVDEGYDYFKRAKTYADRFGYTLSAKDRYLQAEVNTLSGRYEEALQIYEQLLADLPDPVERARVHMRLCRIHQYRREIHRSWEHVTLGLEAIGFRRVNSPILNFLRILYSTIFGFITDYFGIRIESSDREKDRFKIIASLLETGATNAYFLNSTPRFLSCVGPSLEPAARLGITAETAICYCGAGAMFSVLGLKSIASHYTEKALRVIEQTGNPFVGVRARVVRLYILQFSGDWTEARKVVKEIFRDQSRYLEGSDLMNVAFGATSCMTMISGHQLEGLAAIQKSISYLERNEHDPNLREGHPFLNPVLQIFPVAGRNSEASRYLKNIRRNVEERPDDLCGTVGYAGSLLGLHYETRETGPDVDEAIRLGLSTSKVWTPLEMPYYKFFHMFAAYARMNQYDAAKNDEVRTRAREDFKKQLRLFRLATLVPSLTPTRAHVLLLSAVECRIDGRSHDAHALLHRALKMAEEFDLPWVQFEVFRQKARLNRESGQYAQAGLFAELALGVALKYDWSAKANWIREEFEIDASSIGTSRPGPSSSSTHTGTTVVDSLSNIRQNEQLAALIHMSMQSIGVADPKDQIRGLLDEMIQLFGADRGLVFLYDAKTSGVSNFLLGRSDSKIDLLTAENYSTKAIQNAFETEEPYISNQGLTGGIDPSESVIAFNLRSILVVPLITNGEWLGVFYLDNNSVKGIFQESDKRFILSAASAVASAIKAGRAVKTEIEKRDLEKNLQLTGAVQSLLLPKTPRLKERGLEIEGHFQAATVAGGDWWWSETLPDGSSFAFLGDVTGHGAPSAMVTAVVAGMYYVVRNSLTDTSNDPKAAISAFLKLTDHKLHSHMGAEFLMAYSAVHVAIDGTLTMWGAGAPPIVIREDGKPELTVVECYGRNLGTGEVRGEPLATIPGFRGRLFMFSDGLLEILAPSGSPISERSLASKFKNQDDLTRFSDEIRSMIESSQLQIPLGDDVSFVCLKRSA